MRQTKVEIYKHWLILAEELYHGSEPNRNTPYLGDYRRRKLYGAVVFLALALESFINDIGLEYCSDDFASIDRLPTPAKWLIVPKLARREVCSKDREPHRSIQTIFAYRNLFVHFKPRFQPDGSRDFEKMKSLNQALFKKLHEQSVAAMKLASREFKISGMEWLEDKKL